MDIYTIYWIFLLIISFIWTILFMSFRNLNLKEKDKYFTFWKEFILTGILFIFWLFLAKIYFSEVIIFWMQWWLSYVIFTNVLPLIPIAIYHFFYKKIIF